MSSIVRWTLAVMVLTLTAGPSTAQTGTLGTAPKIEPLGGKFIELCQSPNQAGREACGGVIVSLINAHVMIGQKYPDQRMFCPPRRLDPEQARQMFLNWARMQTDLDATQFPGVVITALRERYPCTQPIRP